MITWILFAVYAAGYLYTWPRTVKWIAINSHIDSNYCIRQEYNVSYCGNSLHRDNTCGGSGYSWMLGIVVGTLATAGWPAILIGRRVKWLLINLAAKFNNDERTFDGLFPDFAPIETRSARKLRLEKEAREEVAILLGKRSEVLTDTR